MLPSGTQKQKNPLQNILKHQIPFLRGKLWAFCWFGLLFPTFFFCFKLLQSLLQTLWTTFGDLCFPDTLKKINLSTLTHSTQPYWRSLSAGRKKPRANILHFSLLNIFPVRFKTNTASAFLGFPHPLKPAEPRALSLSPAGCLPSAPPPSLHTQGSSSCSLNEVRPSSLSLPGSHQARPPLINHQKDTQLIAKFPMSTSSGPERMDLTPGSRFCGFMWSQEKAVVCKNYRINQRNRVYSSDKWLQHCLRLTEKGTLMFTWLICPDICMLSLLNKSILSTQGLEDPLALKRTQYLTRHEEIPEKTRLFFFFFF